MAAAAAGAEGGGEDAVAATTAAAAAAGAEDVVREKAPLKPARILEGMAATGLRAIRYARELDGVVGRCTLTPPSPQPNPGLSALGSALAATLL